MQLKDTITSSGDSILGWVEDILKKYNISNDFLYKATDHIGQQILAFTNDWGKWLTNSIPVILDTFWGMTSKLFNFFMAFFLAMYILISKDHLGRGIKRSMEVLMKPNHCSYLLHVAKVAHDCFASFISGQMIEAVILGSLCFIGMMIFNIPQAFLISSVVIACALIPIFGGFISMGVGTLILLIINPGKALLFLIFLFILQQIEGNLIYPRVVGNSIGLNPLWVLMSLIVGGNLFGFLGMVLGIPTFATFFILYREFVDKKAKQKESQIEANPPDDSPSTNEIIA